MRELMTESETNDRHTCFEDTESESDLHSLARRDTR